MAVNPALRGGSARSPGEAKRNPGTIDRLPRVSLRFTRATRYSLTRLVALEVDNEGSKHGKGRASASKKS